MSQRRGLKMPVGVTEVQAWGNGLPGKVDRGLPQIIKDLRAMIRLETSQALIRA